MEISGKTVLLTGATGGLGRTIAGALASRGANLILTSRKEKELQELANALPGNGHRYIVADLAEADAALKLLDEAGDIDILVANAALPGSGRLDDLEPEHVQRALRVNLESPMLMARELLAKWRERNSGFLLFIGSLSGRVASPRTSVYAATKFGLRGFTLCLREDLWGTGIGVSIVEPGFVRDAGMYADSGAHDEMPKFVGTSTPADVARAVIRAIEHNKPEVLVAPTHVKLASGVAYRNPRLASWLSRGNASKIADKITSGQTDKR